MNVPDKKCILITGGAGFIGSHLVELLLNNKYKIILVKKRTTDDWRVSHMIDKINIYDIDNYDIFNLIFKKHKVNIIIHLAGKYIKQHKSLKEVKEMNQSNFELPIALLEMAVKNGVQAFINTGTFFEYRLKGIISEKSELEPYDYYAATKIAFEEILKFYAQNDKIKAITLKLFSPYGERDNEKIIPLLIKSIINEKKIFLTKGDQKLCFTYIGDIANAYLKAIKFITKNYRYYENFNIGSSRNWSIKNVVKEIEDIARKKLNVKFGVISNKKDEVINIKCNLTKAKKMLKWYPSTELEEGLKKTYLYYKNQQKND